MTVMTLEKQLVLAELSNNKSKARLIRTDMFIQKLKNKSKKKHEL